MIRAVPLLVLAAVLAGCAAGPRASAPVPAAASSPANAPANSPAPAQTPASATVKTQSPTDRLSIVQADSDLIDTEREPSARARLVTDAQTQAERCLAESPGDGVCLYARGIVYGLAAREQPLKAAQLLQAMLGTLAKAESLAPAVDHAGPARLQAIVLLRAPAWPLGPGDVEAALAAARRAVALDPAWPGNQTVLKDTLKANGSP